MRLNHVLKLKYNVILVLQCVYQISVVSLLHNKWAMLDKHASCSQPRLSSARKSKATARNNRFIRTAGYHLIHYGDAFNGTG
jgi:hypothetical protein